YLDKEAEPDKQARTRILLAKELIGRDPSAINEILGFIATRDRTSAVRMGIAAAMMVNPNKTISVIESELTGQLKSVAQGVAVNELAKAGDFVTAIDIHRAMVKSSEREISASRLAKTLGKVDPP